MLFSKFIFIGTASAHIGKAVCTRTELFLSLQAVPMGRGGIHAVTAPQPRVCLPHVGTLSNDAACPARRCHSHPASPHQGLGPLSETVSPKECCLSKDTFSVELCKIPTEKPTAPKPAPQWIFTSAMSLSLCPGLGQEGGHSRDPTGSPSSHPSPLERPLPCLGQRLDLV